MRNKFLISLAIAPISYLLIASLLTFLPVTRQPPGETLDFDRLEIPSAIEATAVEKYYRARDGGELFFRYLQGEGDIIMAILHGSGSEGRYLMPFARKINSAMGLSVVVPDLRGHGRSALSKPGDVEYLGQITDDLEDLNRYLRSQSHGAQIILGGHSSGGGLAVRYGGEQRLPVDGYLLLAPYLGYRAPTVRPDSGGWIQVSTRRYAGLNMFNNAGINRFNGLPVLFFNRPIEWNDALQVGSYSYRLNESLAPHAYQADLANITQPLMVLVGDEDEALYPEQFKPIFNRYAPGAKVEIIPGAGHLDLYNSESIIAPLEQWMDRFRKGAPSGSF